LPSHAANRDHARMDIGSIIRVRAGPRAAAQIRQDGIQPADIACIPAAAGGPKGLALLPLDRLLWREVLQHAPTVELVGASVGAWRMMALAQPDPLAALDRVQHAYVREQNYRHEPTPDEVSEACRRIARAALGDGPPQVRPGVALSIITARARGPLARSGSRLVFVRAVAANALGRHRLAAYLQRVLFSAGEPSFLERSHDGFDTVQVPLGAPNAEEALLASGTIPLLCSPVRDIPGAPPGIYWDGALVDYHLMLPYPSLTRAGARQRLVLYPHFNEFVTPGWLDKQLPWRRAPRQHPWLDDMLLIAPSPQFLASLPNGKLPDRQDFYRYGTDHGARIRAWERAIGQCEQFAEATLRWLERPDPGLLQSI